MDKVERKALAERMLEALSEVDELTIDDVVEVAVNVFGFLAQECGMTVHDAVGAVMNYYKANADR